MDHIYTQEFEFTPSDLMGGTDYLSVRAQQELKARGPADRGSPSTAKSRQYCAM